MHLTATYHWIGRADRKPDWLRKRLTQPVTACGIVNDPDQVSVYDNPGDEHLIDCHKCLTWLADDDNRLLVTPGGVEQWVRNRLAAGDESIYFIDIPAGGDDDGE